MSAYMEALVSLQKRSKAQLERFKKSEVRIFKGTKNKNDDTEEYIRGLEKDVIELNSAIASLRDNEQGKI
jgi:hypothetical protein